MGAPAGTAVLSIRYSNVSSAPPASAPSTIGLLVNGHLLTSLVAAPTSSADPWSTLSTTAPLTSGTNSIEVLSGSGGNCECGHRLPVGRAGDCSCTGSRCRPTPWGAGSGVSTPSPTVRARRARRPREPAARPHSNRCTPTACSPAPDGGCWTTPTARSGPQTDGSSPGVRDGDIEDGYLFVYGHDYTGALHTFAQLTGPAPLLPRNVFGVWYSDYTPYSSADIEQTIYPAFEQNQVPLNTLSLDTDWKAPNAWDGWEWNTSLFPDPSSFLQWAKSHGIAVTLNIHSSIADNDPKLPAAQRIAGSTLTSAPISTCTGGPCKVWNWSSVPQAESNFALQQSFQKQGVAFWWLDWCCDESVATMPGITPDSWIGHLYAQDMVNQGQRGFVLARIGSSNDYPEQVYPAGPWSDHTSADRLHRRCLGHLEHAGPGGCAHARRGDHRRALCERRHRKLSGRARAHTPGSARSLRPVGAVRNLPAHPAAALRRREPPALAVPRNR